MENAGLFGGIFCTDVLRFAKTGRANLNESILFRAEQARK